MTRRHFGSIRQLPSGRYQASYWHNAKLHNGPETFKAKASAQAWLSTVEADVSRGMWIDPEGGRATVTELADRWKASNPAKRISSRARDDVVLRVHIIPHIGQAKIRAVTPPDVQALVNGWAFNQSASTVSRQYSALRAMFSYAVDIDWLARSPCRGVKLPRVELVSRPIVRAEELDRLAGALGPTGAPMMWLGAVGGLRWGECAGLQVRDLELLANTVTVEHQLGRDGKLGPPKSAASKRRLSLPHWLVDELAALLADKALTASDSDALVFTQASGAPLDYTNWRQRTWKPACGAAGLAGLRFHDLRSMAATALVAAGVDVKTAQTRMGHSSPQVTLAIYARATEQADRAAADAVGQFFSPSRTQRARLGHGINSGAAN